MQIHFDITGDNRNFLQSMDEVRQRAETTSAVFDRLGKNGFNLGNGVEKNAKTLSQLIDNLSVSAEKSREKLNRLSKEAAEALGKGDVSTFRAKQQEIEIVANNLETLASDMHDYKVALDTLKTYDSKDVFVIDEDKSEGIRTRLRELTQEIGNYTIQLRQMSEEERSSAAGQEISKKLAEAKKEAGNLKDAMMDVNREIAGLASDTGNFDALAEGINVVTSAVGAATGVMAMFGVEEERLQEIQTTLQSSLAISNALSVVQNNLQRESAIMLKVRSVQEAAAAAAITIRSAAEGKGVIATTAATVAQKAFNLVAKANPYVLLATVLMTAVGAVWAFVHGMSAATEEEKKAQKEAEALKRKIAEINKRHEEQAAAAATVETKYKRLQTEWKQLKTVAEKTKWIKDNQSAFSALGRSITSVNDAENFLVKNSNKVIKALLRRAIAAKQAEQAANDIVELRKGRASAVNVRYGTVKGGDDYSKLSEAEKNELTQQGITGKGGKITAEGAQYINSQRAKRAAEQSRANLAEQNRLEKQLISDYEQAILDGMEADKILSDFDSKKTDDKQTSNTTKEDPTAQAQKLADLRAKQELEAARQEAQAILDAKEYERKAREQSTAEKIASINLEYEKEQQAIERAKEDAIRNHEKNARELWEAENPKAGERGQTWENTGKKGRTFTLTEAEQKALTAREQANERQKNKALAEIYKQENDVRRKYLKTFGDLVQQEAAINEEYDQRRKEAVDSGASPYALDQIEAERTEAISKNRMEALKEEINWEEVFSNLDYVSTAHLKRLREQLRAALDMGDITAENARIIAEKLGEIDRQIQQKRTAWGQLFGGATQGVGGIVNAIRDQKALNADAAQKREAANKAQADATAATAAADAMLKLHGQDSEQYLKAQREADQKSDDAKKAGQAAEVAEGMAGGSALGATGAIIHGVNDNVQSFAEAAELLGGKDSGFAKDVAKFAESSQYATEGFEKFKSGDFIGAALSVGKAVSSLGETFGLWSNSNVEEMQAENEKLANAMAVNTAALDRLTKAMNEGSATQAYKKYEEALAVMQQNQNASAQTLSNLDSMYDGHHSTEYYFNQKKGQDIVRRMGNYLGQDWSNGHLNNVYWNTGLVNKLYETQEGRDLLKEFTQTLSDAESAAGMEANDIVGKFYEHLSNYSDEAYEELRTAFRQAVTGVSFDSFKDGFKSTLMDMEKSGKDFADTFTEQLTQSFLNTRIEEQFSGKLNDLYTAWSDALSDNNLSEAEVARLQRWQDDLTKEMMAERDRIAALTGYDDVSTSEASGSINAAKSMSEDTANELVGRMTAVQIAVEGVRGQESIMAQQIVNGVAVLAGMSSMQMANNEVLNSILLQHVQSNSYLEDISKYNKAMYDEWGSQINAMRAKIETL